EKPRKRTRTVKSKTDTKEPALIDESATLFSLPDEKEEPAEPLKKPEEPTTTEPKTDKSGTETRGQKTERRFANGNGNGGNGNGNQQQNTKSDSSTPNLDFDNVIVNEGV